MNDLAKHLKIAYPFELPCGEKNSGNDGLKIDFFHFVSLVSGSWYYQWVFYAVSQFRTTADYDICSSNKCGCLTC